MLDATMYALICSLPERVLDAEKDRREQMRHVMEISSSSKKEFVDHGAFTSSTKSE